jgi:hypothetical protein
VLVAVYLVDGCSNFFRNVNNIYAEYVESQPKDIFVIISNIFMVIWGVHYQAPPFIFYPEDGCSSFLRNTGSNLIKCMAARSQKTAVLVLTTVRNSDLKIFNLDIEYGIL